MADPVRVEGLRELRRDLKRISDGAPKAFREAFKDVGRPIAATAAVLAPRGKGRLARSIRPAVRGDQLLIRSRLPYAAVHEFGGTIRPKGAPIQIRRSRMVGRAVDAHSERLVDEVGDAIERLARRHGFR